MTILARGGFLRAAAVTLALLWGAHAAADVVTIDVTTLQSVDFLGDADNVALTIDLNAALGTFGEVTVDGIGWDLTLNTMGDSWLSEARFSLQGSDGTAHVELAPGIEDTFSGSGTYSSGGIVDLVGLGLNFTLSDGILILEFFESFDNVPGLAEAVWGGSLQVSATGVVPVPAGVWLLGSALLALAARRK